MSLHCLHKPLVSIPGWVSSVCSALYDCRLLLALPEAQTHGHLFDRPSDLAELPLSHEARSQKILRLRHGLSKIAVAGSRSAQDDSSAGPQSSRLADAPLPVEQLVLDKISQSQTRRSAPHLCRDHWARPRDSATSDSAKLVNKSIRRESPREAKLFNHGPPAGAAAGGEARLPRPLVVCQTRQGAFSLSRRSSDSSRQAALPESTALFGWLQKLPASGAGPYSQASGSRRSQSQGHVLLETTPHASISRGVAGALFPVEQLRPRCNQLAAKVKEGPHLCQDHWSGG